MNTRLASIDVFRAITMFLMIFVNDFWTLYEVPAWLEHAPANADAMGFSDIIFPAFLFIVGLSIPLSQRSRLAAGESRGLIFRHIFLRSLALIVMGFYHVNMENYSSEALLPKPWWVILVTVSFFLIWLDYRHVTTKLVRPLQFAGIALLIVSAFLYTGETDNGSIGMTAQWWGILGLIGWAYFLCATLFLLANDRLAALVALFIFFVLFNAGTETQWPEFMGELSNVVGWLMGGSGSNSSIIMAGVIVSVLYSKAVSHPGKMVVILISMVLLLFVFGFASSPAWGISKIGATPSWTTICTAISILAFGSLIFLIDRKGKQDWFRIIKPAGTSTLTCYLIPYIWYAVLISIMGVRLPAFLRTGVVGIIKSLPFALVIVLITGLLQKARLRLKL